uniref:uncharacterized protein isoform X2 n=1 Tax=Myxine glutinosa TaxID=7769 RepID=UPI00358EC157
MDRTSGCLFLCLLSIFFSVGVAQSDAESLDGETQRECHFSLEQMLDCVQLGCLTPSKHCNNNSEHYFVCGIKECRRVKLECEKPLNKYLSPEEICEEDEFSKVDSHCVNSHKFLKGLQECKMKGYMEAKRTCLESVYTKRIQIQECTLNNCFSDVQDCLKEYHFNLSMNLEQYRKFNNTTCTFIAVEYAQDCEMFTSRNCSLELKQCHIACSTSWVSVMVPVFVILISVSLFIGGGLFYLRYYSTQQRRHAAINQLE